MASYQFNYEREDWEKWVRSAATYYSVSYFFNGKKIS